MTNKQKQAAKWFWSRKPVLRDRGKKKKSGPLRCSACMVVFADDEEWLKHEPACTAANRFHF